MESPQIKQYKFSVQFQMNKLLLGFLVFFTVYAAQFRRLQTEAVTRLKAEDRLISTLGIFRLTLKKSECKLNIEVFDGNQSYVEKGNYSSPAVQTDCEYLELSIGKLATNSGSQYMKVDGTYTSSSFTIDDNGVILLLSIENTINTQVIPNQGEFRITTFQTAHPFIKSISNREIDFSFTGQLANLRQWKFTVNTAQMEIFKSGNPGIIVAYVFSHLNVKGSGLYDFNDLRMPFALFPNITFAPRCFQPQKFLDHKAPFVFQADPFWPIFKLYEQGRYMIKQVAYGDTPMYDFPSPKRDIHFAEYYSPCPDFTFEHRGNCLAICPQPYYYEMIGAKGQCVLTCEEDSIIDEANRICSCMTPYQAPKFNSEFVKGCPTNSQNYPYGCVCNQTNMYFDRLLTYSCVAKCPERTFAQNGLCMQCPANCQQCQIDGFYRAFLECKVCQTNYRLLQTGKCALTCNLNYGLVPSSTNASQCIKCTDRACIDCRPDPSTCSKCNPNYALQNGSCVQQCGSNFKQAHKDKAETVCLQKDSSCLSMMSSNYRDYSFLKCDSCSGSLVSHIGSCVSGCPSGFNLFNSRYCVCQNKSEVTVGGRCIILAGCPIKTSLDIRSGSCISCPEGCISCSQNSCTSCVPGYFLRVAPQFVTCFRKSPLTNCEQQFSLQQGVCLVNNFAGLDMTLCLATVTNCRVCTRLSKDFCVLCKEGFRLYNNTCIVSCPEGLIGYQNVCIVPQITNCSVPHLLTEKFPITVNRTILLDNKPYSYYIQNQISPFNVPVGYIPYSQFLIQLQDKRTREAYVSEVSWTCLKCITGMGLSDNYSSCLPCPMPCSTCYFARNDSCLSVESTPPPVQNQTCIYRQRNTNQCLRSCNQPDIPLIQNGILYCVPFADASVQDVVRVDSAVYQMRDGSKVTYFVFQGTFQNSPAVTIQIKSIPSLAKLRKLGVQQPRLLQNNDSNVQTVGSSHIERDFVQINNTNNDIFILNLTDSLRTLKDTEGRLFPNPVYGVETLQSHPEFMRVWLSFIGFIMSCVIIILHVWFIGNELMYKMDNVIILAQSIYYFSFVKLLVGRLAAQFYFGWIWAHAGWFPNYFAGIIPDAYHQRNAPNSYKLATLDSNVIRSGGYSLSLFFTFMVAALAIIFIVYAFSKFTRRHQIWHPKIAKFSLLAAFQFLSMNLMYWSVACLLYNQGGELSDKGYFNTSIILSIIFISVISIYTIGRFFFSILGGIYMVKRVLVAVILAAAAAQKLYFLAVIIALELVFIAARWAYEKPQTFSQIFYLIVEEILILTCYFLLFLSINAGVNTIIISIIMFLFIISLSNDLTEVYLESQNEWLIEDDDLNKRQPQNVATAKRVPQNQIINP